MLTIYRRLFCRAFRRRRHAIIDAPTPRLIRHTLNHRGAGHDIFMLLLRLSFSVAALVIIDLDFLFAVTPLSIFVRDR